MGDKRSHIIQDIPEGKEADAEIFQFIGIRLEKEIYGIEVNKVKEVAKPFQITPIPGTPSHIMGLMNLHGEILCVVDLKVLLAMGTAGSTENSKIIVVKTAEGPVGVFCDEVIDIFDIMKKDLEIPLSTLSSAMGEYIKAQAQTRCGLMGILDIEKLLYKQEK
jgi:purine-binding chemotaxis protein CheW